MGPLKTAPTDLDREAAQLFDAAPGMRVAYASHANGRDKFEWCRVRDGARGVYGAPCAIDTDDPATVGCMLGQVEGAKPGAAVTIVDRMQSLAHEPDRRFQAIVTGAEGWQSVHAASTRGAALVAAMRALKGATNDG